MKAVAYFLENEIVPAYTDAFNADTDLGRAVLSGEIKQRIASQTLFVIDETLQPHTFYRTPEIKKKFPKIKMVELQNVKVEIHSIGNYSISFR